MSINRITLLREDLLSKLNTVQYRIERLQRHYSPKEVETWFEHRADLISKLKALPSDGDIKQARRRILDYRIDIESIELYREQIQVSTLARLDTSDDIDRGDNQIQVSTPPDEYPFKSGDRVYYVNSKGQKMPCVIVWISAANTGPCARVRFDDHPKHGRCFRSGVRIKNLIPQ